MRKPVIVLAVLAATVGLASPSFAGGLPKARPLTATDPAGDANFANSQGGLLPASPPGPPASVRAGADITKLTLGRLDNRKVVKALKITMTLAAAPEATTQYRVAMSAPGCSVYYVEYQFPAAGTDVALTKGGLIRENCTGSSVFTDVDAVVAGNSITWTIPVKGMPGDVGVGTPLTVEYAQTNFETAAVVPAFDELPIDKPFIVGQ